MKGARAIDLPKFVISDVQEYSARSRAKGERLKDMGAFVPFRLQFSAFVCSTARVASWPKIKGRYAAE